MRLRYQVIDSDTITKPCKAIIIANAEILNIDLNKRWNITDVKVPYALDVHKIKKLIVTFEAED